MDLFSSQPVHADIGQNLLPFIIHQVRKIFKRISFAATRAAPHGLLSPAGQVQIVPASTFNGFCRSIVLINRHVPKVSLFIGKKRARSNAFVTVFFRY